MVLIDYLLGLEYQTTQAPLPVWKTEGAQCDWAEEVSYPSPPCGAGFQ